jgi:hypothetical protein
MVNVLMELTGAEALEVLLRRKTVTGRGAPPEATAEEARLAMSELTRRWRGHMCVLSGERPTWGDMVRDAAPS